MNDKPKKIKSKKKSLVLAMRQKGTLVPPDPFSAYLQEAKKYPILTEEEEKELAIRLRETGDVDAAYQLTTANLMLVVKIP
jgi:RNA polymerase sigma-32 factor